MNNTTYSTGSVSVAASGTTVTGSGTAWLSSGIREGDLIMIGGLTAQIAAVGTNTSLTLKRAWPGAAQSGANYDIIMLDDEVRGLIAANALLQALSGGTLTSLGQIAGAANQMPYWTGTGVMGATGLTPEARALIGSTLLSRSGNNLVTELNARMTGGVVVQNKSDVTPGRIPTVGYMGLGGTAVILSAGDDLDTMREAGFYGMWSASNIPLNAPTGMTHGSILVQSVSSAIATQIAVSVAGSGAGQSGSSFIRARNGATWGPWRRLYTDGNIIGAVGQSAGIPTGAIIERGSNSNGEYVKFADGTMICMGVGSAVATAVSSGAVFSSDVATWTFPAAFSHTPYVTGACVETQRWLAPSVPALTSCQYRHIRTSASTSESVARLIAIGRCF